MITDRNARSVRVEYIFDAVSKKTVLVVEPEKGARLEGLAPSPANR
jgi:hypothetical protein